MGSPFNPIRDQVRSEMLSALAGGATMTTNELYSVCPSAVDARDVSRLAYELRKKGLIASGEPVLNALGVRVNSFFLPTTSDPRIEASKPIVVERKIPKTGKSNKPRASNPYAQFTVSKPQEEAPRVTRDLPIHLTTTAPQAAAVALDEDEMSEDPMPYVTEPDAFSQEPREPESEENIDSDLVDALLEMAHLEPQAAAVDDVGKITDGLSQSQDFGPESFLPKAETNKICQCPRAKLPTLPAGYLYGGIKVRIDSEHDVGHLILATVDEGGGAFITLKARGRLAFDTGELVTIGQVADELIRLHESMGGEHE